MTNLRDEVKQLRDEVKQLSNAMKQLSNAMGQLQSHPILKEDHDLENIWPSPSAPLTRHEVKQMINESMPNPGNNLSIRKIFAQSYVHGLRELANESLRGILKIVWLSILFVSLILLTYQITEITKDYAGEVTITQISQIKTNLTEVNRPFVCFLIFPDFLYRRADSGSFDDLEPLDNDSLLYLGYIKAMMPHFASSGLWLSHIPAENITWSQFQSLPARSWLSMSQETASLLSQNTLYESLYYWGIGQLNDANDSELPGLRSPMSRSKLTHVKNFYSDILSRAQYLDGARQYWEGTSWICVPINFSTINWISPSEKDLKWFTYGHYFGEPASAKILKSMEFSIINFNTKHFALDPLYANSYMDPDTVYKFDTTNYILVPTKFQHRNLSRRKCYDAKGEIYPRGYGETICFHDCLWENHARLFNCSFWEDFNEHPSLKVGHIFDILDQVRSHMSDMCSSDGDQVWCNNETSDSADAWNRLILQTYRDKVINDAYLTGCKQKCDGWTFCDEWELQYELLYKHEKGRLTKSAENWSGHLIYREYTVSYFTSVNKEVLKASFEEFIAGLGGTIGFYFGFSICGFLQLLLFLSIYGFGKVLGLRKRGHSQADDSQPSTTHTQDDSRNIGMAEIEKIQEPIEAD